MTVESQTVKVIGTGNDVATTFSFSPMAIFDSTQLLVTHVDAAGVETVLTEGTGAAKYAVVVTSYPGTGSIRYPENAVTPLPTGEFVYIKRLLPLKQLTNLENQGGYFPSTQENTFDKGVMIDLQQQEELDRTIQVPLSDDVVSLELPIAATRANKVLSFTATGAVTATAASGGVSDHGALTGLADDDHTQYLLKAGGQLTGNITMAGAETVDGRDLSADGTKLDGIESGATADQSAAEILTAIKTVDGAGSGLDADLLDGLSSAAFATAAQGTLADSALQNVVEDTTPQLGGNLDVNGSSIVSASAGNIAITPNTTGDLILDGLKWPQADGTANQVLKTNGAAQLSWATPSGGSGAVVQIVRNYLRTVVTNASVPAIPLDNTIPQNTEGTEFLTLAITPTSATNILKIDVSFQVAASTDNPNMALFQDSTAGALAAVVDDSAASTPHNVSLTHYMVAGTTIATTFKVRLGCNATATITVNGDSTGNQLFGGVGSSHITITEFTP